MAAVFMTGHLPQMVAEPPSLGPRRRSTFLIPMLRRHWLTFPHALRPVEEEVAIVGRRDPVVAAPVQSMPTSQKPSN